MEKGERIEIFLEWSEIRHGDPIVLLGWVLVLSPRTGRRRRRSSRHGLIGPPSKRQPVAPSRWRAQRGGKMVELIPRLSFPPLLRYECNRCSSFFSSSSSASPRVFARFRFLPSFLLDRSILNPPSNILWNRGEFFVWFLINTRIRTARCTARPLDSKRRRSERERALRSAYVRVRLKPLDEHKTDGRTGPASNILRSKHAEQSYAIVSCRQ